MISNNEVGKIFGQLYFDGKLQTNSLLFCSLKRQVFEEKAML